MRPSIDISRSDSRGVRSQRGRTVSSRPEQALSHSRSRNSRSKSSHREPRTEGEKAHATSLMHRFQRKRSIGGDSHRSKSRSRAQETNPHPHRRSTTDCVPVPGDRGPSRSRLRFDDRNYCSNPNADRPLSRSGPHVGHSPDRGLSSSRGRSASRGRSSLSNDYARTWNDDCHLSRSMNSVVQLPLKPPSKSSNYQSPFAETKARSMSNKTRSTAKRVGNASFSSRGRSPIGKETKGQNAASHHNNSIDDLVIRISQALKEQSRSKSRDPSHRSASTSSTKSISSDSEDSTSSATKTAKTSLQSASSGLVENYNINNGPGCAKTSKTSKHKLSPIPPPPRRSTRQFFPHKSESSIILTTVVGSDDDSETVCTSRTSASTLTTKSCSTMNIAKSSLQRDSFGMRGDYKNEYSLGCLKTFKTSRSKPPPPPPKRLNRQFFPNKSESSIILAESVGSDDDSDTVCTSNLSPVQPPPSRFESKSSSSLTAVIGNNDKSKTVCANGQQKSPSPKKVTKSPPAAKRVPPPPPAQPRKGRSGCPIVSLNSDPSQAAKRVPPPPPPKRSSCPVVSSSGLAHDDFSSSCNSLRKLQVLPPPPPRCGMHSNVKLMQQHPTQQCSMRQDTMQQQPNQQQPMRQRPMQQQLTQDKSKQQQLTHQWQSMQQLTQQQQQQQPNEQQSPQYQPSQQQQQAQQHQVHHQPMQQYLPEAFPELQVQGQEVDKSKDWIKYSTGFTRREQAVAAKGEGKGSRRKRSKSRDRKNKQVAEEQRPTARTVKQMPFTDQFGDFGMYTGNVDEDGRPDGKGSIKYENGVFYEGIWEAGCQDKGAASQYARIRGGFTSWSGKGKSQSKSGAVLPWNARKDDAQNVGGKMNCRGLEWMDLNGDSGRYTGEVNVDQLPHGNGIMRYDFGLIAEGEWANGVLKEGPQDRMLGVGGTMNGGQSLAAGVVVNSGVSVGPGAGGFASDDVSVLGNGGISVAPGGGAGMGGMMMANMAMANQSRQVSQYTLIAKQNTMMKAGKEGNAYRGAGNVYGRVAARGA